MAMDAKTKKKRTIQIAAAAIVVLVMGLLAILIFADGDEAPAENTLGPSDSMVPADPATVAVNSNGSLVANPASIQLNPQMTSQIFMLMAAGAPVVIQDARIPDEYAGDLQVTGIDCPPPSAALNAGEGCSVSVNWSAQRPVSTAIEFVGMTAGTTGREVSLVVPVSTQGGDPNALPLGDPTAIGAFPDQTSGMVPTAPAPTDVTQPMPAMAPQPAMDDPRILRQQQRDAYSTARRGASLTGISPAQLAPSAKSPYTSWNNIGAQGQTSSFPTDMSRVVTPDKAITAVISNPIDTRMAVTAVAMVDRDIYGSNGRTVVIPRGSKLIGQIGVASERVGVAWSQLIRPDGVRFVFEGTSGDAMGRGGIPGRVNERLLQRYGYSILPSAAAAGVTAALGGNRVSNNNGVGGTTQQQDARSVAADILTQPLQQIAQDIYQRKSNMPTQITVPAGTRITVWSVGDLRLKPVGERDTAEEAQASRLEYGSGSAVALPGTSNRTNRPNNAPANGRNGDGQSEGNPDMGVGTIDENGNWSPGPSAPAPNTTPLSLQRNGGSAFGANNNLWQN